MPTGYTYFIENGEITTGNEFLKRCTRAFGVAVEMRDEPLSVPTPRHFKPDPYYLKNYREAVAALEEVEKITPDEARREMQMNHRHELERYKDIIRKQESLNAKYEAIRKEIVDWIPPTEEHNGLKKFALDQIDISFDDMSWYYDRLEELNHDLDPSDEAVSAYISEQIEFAKEEVERTYKRYQEEIKRTEDRNKWIDEFYKSIGE